MFEGGFGLKLELVDTSGENSKYFLEQSENLKQNYDKTGILMQNLFLTNRFCFLVVIQNE